MTARLPIAIAAFTLAAFGLLALAQAQGIEALLGPTLAATISTIVVLGR